MRTQLWLCALELAVLYASIRRAQNDPDAPASGAAGGPQGAGAAAGAALRLPPSQRAPLVGQALLALAVACGASAAAAAAACLAALWRGARAACRRLMGRPPKITSASSAAPLPATTSTATTDTDSSSLNVLSCASSGAAEEFVRLLQQGAAPAPPAPAPVRRAAAAGADAAALAVASSAAKYSRYSPGSTHTPVGIKVCGRMLALMMIHTNCINNPTKQCGASAVSSLQGHWPPPLAPKRPRCTHARNTSARLGRCHAHTPLVRRRRTHPTPRRLTRLPPCWSTRSRRPAARARPAHAASPPASVLPAACRWVGTFDARDWAPAAANR